MATRNEAQPRRVKVKGVVVRKLREKKNLSREEVVDRLAEMGAASTDLQKLKRIENRKRDTYPVVFAVAEGLAKLFQTKLTVLTGEDPLPDEKTTRDALPEFSAPLPREFHNALAEVCFVYGVSPATVIANAPLTFAIMAQRSLDARSRSLEDMRTAVDQLESRRSHLGRLHVRSRNPDAEATWTDEVFAAEASSIAARDILGEGIQDLRSREGEDEIEASPFLDFLREEARTAGITTAPCLFYPEATLIPVPGEDGKDLVSSAIEAITGGDTELQEAIAHADFIIPARAWRALRSAPPEKRIAALRRWMERDEYSATRRELRKQLSDDLSALLLTAQEGDA